MQFLLTAYDGIDEKAPERRFSCRAEHLDKVAVLKKNGNFLFGGAILDDNGLMRGSMIVYEVPDRETLDNILKEEPYIINKVWVKIDITPFRLAVI